MPKNAPPSHRAYGQILPFADEGQQYDCWDTTLPRFGLRIGKRTKTFILNAGKKRATLSRSPQALAAAECYLDAIKSEKKASTVNAYTIYLKRRPGLPLHELDAHNLYAALPSGKGAANLCFSTFKAFLVR